MVFCRVGRFDPFDMDLMTGLALFVCARGQKITGSGNYTRSAEATSGLRRTIALEWMAEAIFHAYRDEDGGGELSGLRVQPTPGSIALQFVVARGDSREVMDSKKDVKKKLYWGPRFRLCVPECELFPWLFPCLNEYADGDGLPSVVIPSGGVFNDSASCAVTVTRCYRAPDELKGEPLETNTFSELIVVLRLDNMSVNCEETDCRKYKSVVMVRLRIGCGSPIWVTTAG
ncbi:hypothetical protein EDB86DRAFT_632052 [Lactarius hatsudake]|nr:hypothetical protein EDB86DRAFT_632052 [Lactarius hatsudake]